MTLTKEQIEYKKTFIRWLIGGVIVFLICVTVLLVATNTYTIRFEIDNNTLEAIKSINYTSINNHQCTDYNVLCKNTYLPQTNYSSLLLKENCYIQNKTCEYQLCFVTDNIFDENKCFISNSPIIHKNITHTGIDYKIILSLNEYRNLTRSNFTNDN
jgi:hypothetical protein